MVCKHMTPYGEKQHKVTQFNSTMILDLLLTLTHTILIPLMEKESSGNPTRKRLFSRLQLSSMIYKMAVVGNNGTHTAIVTMQTAPIGESLELVHSCDF